jgi:osmotically-inducible protein OsmY
MEDAHIHVFEEGGICILEGDAPSIDAIERASQIAMAIVGPKVCNRIHPVDSIHIVRR